MVEFIIDFFFQNNLIQNNRHLLEISFDYTDGFYGDMDGDDMYDDVDEDDEDFFGYDNEEHLWGLDYDSELGNKRMISFYNFKVSDKNV